MCHKKIRKKDLTTTFTHHNLLHSDKSTYFYKHKCKLSKRFLFASIPLLGSAIALLVVVGALVCPIVGSGSNNNILDNLLSGFAGTESVYAAESTAANPDFSISLNLGSNIQSEQQLDHGIVGYIETTFTVSSKSTESYSVYLQPAEGSTSNLVGATHKQEIPGVGNNVSVDSFTNNTWGYGISDTDNTTIENQALTYSTIPNGSTPIKTVSKPDDGDDTYKLVFAARIGDDKPVDHYQSQVLLSVTASAKAVTTYTVTYNGNGNTGGTAPATQTATSANASHTFQAAGANTLTKTGYAFQGWATSASSSTVNYAAGSNITLAQASPTLTLYAVWKNNGPNLGNITYMQEVTPEICSRTPEADASGNNQFQLTDKRDNKKYWVAKLKDGNCWMTQNLDLDLNGKTLTTADSDVTTNWTSTTGASAIWRDSGSDIIKYYDPGNKYCTDSNCSATSSSNGGHDHQGNYYSFNAATAGTGASVTTGGQNATSSICPKGWQLPTSNSTTNNKSFGKMTTSYGIGDNAAGSTALRAAPLYFIYGGYLGSGSLSNIGSEGRYWSSTAISYRDSYHLCFGSSYANPSTYNYGRYYGFSIRCLVR